MGTNYKTAHRWLFIVGYLGIVISMLACMAIGLGTSNVDAGTLQIDNGSIEVKGQNGEWMPVAGASTFELVGALKSMNPWNVAGTALETNETTQIEDGLQVEDLVRVRGTILEDGKWVAYSIERAEEQTNPSSTIVIVGKVTSTDPWVVNGITLNVTADTVITGNITAGMLVRVEILLSEDGTWEVLSIAPLGNFTEVDGCVTVAATIVSVTEDEIQFVGWPSMPLGSDVKIESGSGGEEREQGDEGEQGNEGQGSVVLSPDQNVLVVLCPSEDSQIVITQIIIIVVAMPDDSGNSTEGEKVLICHKPDKKGGHTLSVSASAVPAHLAHGDKLGPCP
jgi:Domain of unknown function (DUF5666)